VSHARPVPLRVCSVFFFQAEDGIRDFHVTGVQTCALPILRNAPPAAAFMLLYARRRRRVAQALGELSLLERLGGRGLAAFPWRRSEERRGGEEGGERGGPDHGMERSHPGSRVTRAWPSQAR